MPWRRSLLALILGISLHACSTTRGSATIPPPPRWTPVETVACEHAVCLTEEGARTFNQNILELTSWAREAYFSCHPDPE